MELSEYLHNDIIEFFEREELLRESQSRTASKIRATDDEFGLFIQRDYAREVDEALSRNNKDLAKKIFIDAEEAFSKAPEGSNEREALRKILEELAIKIRLYVSNEKYQRNLSDLINDLEKRGVFTDEFFQATKQYLHRNIHPGTFMQDPSLQALQAIVTGKAQEHHYNLLARPASVSSNDEEEKDENERRRIRAILEAQKELSKSGLFNPNINVFVAPQTPATQKIQAPAPSSAQSSHAESGVLSASSTPSVQTPEPSQTSAQGLAQEAGLRSAPAPTPTSSSPQPFQTPIFVAPTTPPEVKASIDVDKLKEEVKKELEEELKAKEEEINRLKEERDKLALSKEELLAEAKKQALAAMKQAMQEEAKKKKEKEAKEKKEQERAQKRKETIRLLKEAEKELRKSLAEDKVTVAMKQYKILKREASALAGTPQAQEWQATLKHLYDEIQIKKQELKLKVEQHKRELKETCATLRTSINRYLDDINTLLDKQKVHSAQKKYRRVKELFLRYPQEDSDGRKKLFTTILTAYHKIRTAQRTLSTMKSHADLNRQQRKRAEEQPRAASSFLAAATEQLAPHSSKMSSATQEPSSERLAKAATNHKASEVQS
ncbi:hypothetical protein D6783_03645 [Candidatus Woesearchaeota archaeon]|nr:MAG: hypothetical protein D6783_03645 [Candidatus Woesearchaeota archaeon]